MSETPFIISVIGMNGTKIAGPDHVKTSFHLSVDVSNGDVTMLPGIVLLKLAKRDSVTHSVG